jgi:hypothetical protein
MKPLRNQPALLVCVLAMALGAGCARKKAQPVTPTVAQSPATPAQPTPEPTPEPQTQNAGAQPAAQGTPPPAPDESQPADKSDKSKPRNGKTHTAKKNQQGAAGNARPTSETARNNSPRVVVKPDDAAGGPTPGVISPGPALPDTARDQATTDQLLQSTETNLNNIKRQLSQDEQAIVAQIRDYMNQSRQATKENDLVRAHNLALKAQLLSDDLARRR